MRPNELRLKQCSLRRSAWTTALREMDHVRRYSLCGQRRRCHETRWELGVLVMIWLALDRCDACLTSEASALLEIRSSILPEDLSDMFYSWEEDTDCCRDWTGVSCDDRTGAVRLLQIATNWRVRPLVFQEFPAAVCTLTELRGIIITGAQFNSGFPVCLWSMRLRVLDMNHTSLNHARIPEHGLSYLRVLRFRSVNVPGFNWKDLFHPNSSLEVLDIFDSAVKAHLDGILPANFGAASRLRSLSLISNGLSGQIPPSIGNLTSLYKIDLSRNRLKRGIPDEFGQLRGLTILHLNGNRLKGRIPKGLSTLTNLVSLDLGYNSLKGGIPEWFGQLSNLEELKLDHNRLSGKLPASVGNLRKLEVLLLNANKRLTGVPGGLTGVPEEIANISGLVTLDLSNNLIEEIPELKDLTTLRFLYLRNNKLKGIPDTVGRLSTVEELDLRGNNFAGPIPEFLGNLTGLFSIDLSNNVLSGTIPDALVNLDTEQLHLCYNQLSGPVPPTLLNMTTLRTLNVSNNQLSGPLPDVLFSWNITLDLSSNHLVGTIHSFENSSKLYLSHNNFTGDLPLPSGNNSFVDAIDFSSNLLTGGIFALERYNSLRHISLSSNNFGGLIPSFTSLPRLELLRLGRNQFTGSIPSSLGSLQGMQILKLSDNQLTGGIPNSLGNLSELRVLDLSGNSLAGQIPRNLGNLQWLIQLKLQNSSLSGSIPDTFCKKKGDHQLQSLSLGENQLSGKIPTSIRNCKYLKLLDLANNRLTGRLPNTTTLRVLLVSSNQLVGKLPPTLAHSEYLQILDLSNNNFRGRIPRNLANLTGFNWPSSLKEQTMYEEDITFVVKGRKLRFSYVLSMQTSINLANNRLNGTIPSQLGLLHQLQHLNLSGNSFTGGIPMGLGNITDLESLDVSGNQLSGYIPWNLTGLNSLAVANFSNNSLTGPIPQGNQFSTFPRSCFELNSGLCGDQLGIRCGESTNTSGGSLASFGNEDPFTQAFKLGFCIGFSFICVIGSAYFYFSSFQAWVSECVARVSLRSVMNLHLCKCLQVNTRRDDEIVRDESNGIPRQDDEAHISRWTYSSAHASN